MTNSEIVKALRNIDHGSMEDCFLQSPLFEKAADEIERLRAENARQTVEIARLREVVGYVETWICNPASSYSVYALDGLFSVTRDKINDAPARR